MKRTPKAKPIRNEWLWSALAMVKLAVEMDKARTRKDIIKSAREYGAAFRLRREEVEWVLDHTVMEVIEQLKDSSS